MDRLEELLAMLEAEDEDEEREDVPAMRARTVPAAPEEDDGETAPAGDRRRGTPAGADGSGPDRTAGERPEEDPQPAEETAACAALLEAQAAWRRELAEKPGEALEAARRLAGEAAEAAGARLSAEKGAELARTVRHEGESGLEGLYRQTVQAVRPAPQALPVEQAGRTLRAEEPGRTAALTVDELDRMVRRDSRRYDGGMTIF